MGCCLSKKNSSSDVSEASKISGAQEDNKSVTRVERNNVLQEESVVKKEIFLIKHRNSHEVERRSEDENKSEEGEKNWKDNGGVVVKGAGAQVRTSSCTKEEVESILIQCGRLSRSSSTGKAGLLDSDGGGRRGGGGKYSGSKRSYDFDSETRKGEDDGVDGDDDERVNRHRQRHRSRTPSSPSKGRRRTPSRGREPGQGQQNRSGSSRRVSRSPGRRSESPMASSSNNNGGNNSSAGTNRPQKMVSVPPSVSSLAMDKSNNNNNGDPLSASAIKRIQVKRYLGGGGGNGDASVGGGSSTRSVASPRARSPARTNPRLSSDNHQPQQPPLSLSRSNSRKAEQSPYRRNPLSEIDNNVVVIEQRSASGVENNYNLQSQASAKKLSEPESLKPHGVTRSRSTRVSRDLDINPEEALADPTPSYTALLLEDIQNFHQKGSGSTPATGIGGAAFLLPACVSKACSILEAVADLNSTTSSNLSNAFSEGRKGNHHPSPPGMKKRAEESNKAPFMESEILATDDLVEPSFHKYVTIRRGGSSGVGGETDEQESSGSNSFVGSQQQQHWVSSSSWEPNSAESTDRWTCSRTNGDEDCSPFGLQRRAVVPETSRQAEERRNETAMAKRRECDQKQQNGIGRGRISSKGLQHYSMATSSSSSAAAACGGVS